jgi:hypothetical protein
LDTRELGNPVALCTMCRIILKFCYTPRLTSPQFLL